MMEWCYDVGSLVVERTLGVPDQSSMKMVK